MKKEQEAMGAYWMKTKYPVTYQLFRRLEKVADQLEKRRLEGHGPLRAHVVELRDISFTIRKSKITLPKE